MSRRVFIRKFVLLSTISALLMGWNVGLSHAADAQAVYKQLCSFCHDDGTLGAPIRGDQELWRERLEDGRERLYESALDGMGHMPGRRGRRNIFDRSRGSFTDDDIRRAVDYLLGDLGCVGKVEIEQKKKTC